MEALGASLLNLLAFRSEAGLKAAGLEAGGLASGEKKAEESCQNDFKTMSQ